jgi:hypothetical protein
MEKLIDVFCHAIRITDPLSIKIAIGIVGGGLPLLFLAALFIMLSDFVVRQRETTVPKTPSENPAPDAPDRSKGKASRRPRSAQR